MASVGALIRREMTLRSMPKFAPRIVRLEPSERFGQEVGKQINGYPTAVKRRQWEHIEYGHDHINDQSVLKILRDP